MNLVLVTFDLDDTQFLVDANTYNLDCSHECVRKEAVRIAIETNEELGGFSYDEDGMLTVEEARDESNYSVESVDFEMLAELIKRNDLYGKVGRAIVFSW